MSAQRSAGEIVRGHRRLMPLVVWGALLLALVALAGHGEADRVWDALRAARPGPLVPLAWVALALPAVYAWRWRLLLRSVGADLPLPLATEILVSAALLSYAAPGYLALPARGLLARQLRGIPLTKSAPTLAAEQGLDLLTLSFGALAGAAVVGPAPVSHLLGRLALPDARWLLLLAAGFLVLALPAALLQGRAMLVLSSLATSGRALLADRARRGPILATSIIDWLLDVGGVWLAVLAVGVHLGLGAGLLLGNLPFLVGQLSPMPGGLGFREGAMAAVAAALGLPVTTILAAALVHRALLVMALPVLLVALRGYRAAAAWR